MRCCKCGEDKPQTEFHAGRTECKPCKKAISWANKKRRLASDPNYRARRNAELREWKRRNPEKVRVWRRAWKKTPLSKLAARLRERATRSRTNALGRGVTRHCLQLLVLQRGRCAVCRVQLGDDKHLDHIIPLAAGGGHEVGNFQWLCPPCNLSKHAKHPVDFMQSRGYLL